MKIALRIIQRFQCLMQLKYYKTEFETLLYKTKEIEKDSMQSQQQPQIVFANVVSSAVFIQASKTTHC